MKRRMFINSCILAINIMGLSALLPEKQGSAENATITWFGHAMFLLEDSQGTRIIIDPCSEKVGYKPGKVKADAVLVSHHHYDHDDVSLVDGKPEVIDTVGRHTIKNVTIDGIASYHDEVKGQKRGSNIIFKLFVDGLQIAHMGDFGQPITEEQIAELKGIDVLFIPVGGTYTIDHKQAAEIVKIVEPKIAVPMHFKTKDCKIDIKTVEPFLREMAFVTKKGATIKISKATIPNKTEVWLMDYIR